MMTPGISQGDIDVVIAAADRLDDALSRTGQIGLLSGPRKFWPIVISVITRSSAYHSVVDVGGGECVSAEPGGVKLRPVTDFPHASWSKFPLTRRRRLLIAGWARAQVGLPYNYMADLIIGVALVTHHRPPRWADKYLRGNGRWECAGLAEAALMRAGIRIFRDGSPYGVVFPGAYLSIFKDFGWAQFMGGRRRQCQPSTSTPSMT